MARATRTLIRFRFTEVALKAIDTATSLTKACTAISAVHCGTFGIEESSEGTIFAVNARPAVQTDLSICVGVAFIMAVAAIGEVAFGGCGCIYNRSGGYFRCGYFRGCDRCGYNRGSGGGAGLSDAIFNAELAVATRIS